MSSSEHGGNPNVPDREIKVEMDNDDVTDHEMPQSLEGRSSNCLIQQLTKRSELHAGLDGLNPEQNQSASRKRPKVGDNFQEGTSEDAPRSHSGMPFPVDIAILSIRKPLYGISHRITEKKTTSTDQLESGVRVGHNGTLFPKLGNQNHNHSSTSGSSTSPVPADSHLYPLFEKMFFILNSLNSSMSQLHSKVDLLSLEVTRIKKQMKPSEGALEFQPPPEYQLTREELGQLMEQTSTAGELGCRLLVQLFPELFTAKECAQGCRACGISSKPSLDSLHLQLIRNYVESCYPMVKNGNFWQNECLLQINEFFNRFWAQKDLESVPGCGQTGIDVDQNHGCHFINEDGQDERISIDSGESESQFSNIKSDLASDSQENPDDVSSPEEFVVFLLNRLFPEVFEERRLPDGHSTAGQLIIDSNRLEIMRKYMEANFPELPEDTWLQLCIQRLEEAIEGAKGGNQENNSDDTYDPDDISIVNINELCDASNLRAKGSGQEHIEFDKMDISCQDFEVPQEYLLTREQLKTIYDSSLSIGNFASRLLVLMFPELFTQENARRHYNCSGSMGKKQLDPIRINLIRHYVQLVYPRAKNDRVWTLEFVGKLDERCRRRDTEQRRSYQQNRKIYPSDQDLDVRDLQINSSRPKEETEAPLMLPEKSSKDFCKVPLEDLKVSVPDFPVPSSYLLSDREVQDIVQQSLSVGNFAARLLVRLFPELFTPENLRLQYNHSGACNKKQLDPVRLRLIKHYVEAVYPVEKLEEVWHYECVPSIDERCRRPNRKKCDILKKAKRSNSTVS
ncbi:BEN domain-containing protein 3 isoform X2 [Trichomycterus rosablanca]